MRKDLLYVQRPHTALFGIKRRLFFNLIFSPVFVWALLYDTMRVSLFYDLVLVQDATRMSKHPSLKTSFEWWHRVDGVFLCVGPHHLSFVTAHSDNLTPSSLAGSLHVFILFHLCVFFCMVSVLLFLHHFFNSPTLCINIIQPFLSLSPPVALFQAHLSLPQQAEGYANELKHFGTWHDLIFKLLMITQK